MKILSSETGVVGSLSQQDDLYLHQLIQKRSDSIHIKSKIATSHDGVKKM